MIRLFNKDETNFDSNGLGVLDSEIKENVVEEKMNGIYNFDFAYLSKGEHASQLEGDMIIKAPTPDGDQLFRVYKVTKNIGFLEVNCYHIFYDLAGNFIEDINIVSQSGQAAITHFKTGLQYATRFKFVSNIVGTNSARMVRLNAVQALLDSSQDNSFLSRWGGEIKRDNFTVYMNDVRGNDKGFKIRHGKNLTGYEANIDYSSVVTRIMPYGYNGLMLPEKYVDSPLRNKYAFTRIKKIEYTNIKAIDPDATSNDEDTVPLKEAYELLRQAAALEYSVNKVDIPTSNFKVTFNNLADTKEYADFKALEKVEPWDYVTVIADNLDIKSRMISYKYDAITKAYKEVELGNYVPSFSDTNTETNNKLSNINNDLNNINNDLNTVAETANGKNSNYYGLSEPSRPVDGDLWYKKNGDKTELWQYDGKSVPPVWKLVVDDATGEEVRQNVDAAQKEAEEAKKQANKAVDGANDAVAKAGFANDTAEEAKSDAATATQDATTALTNAGTAFTNAKNALDNVNKLDQTVKTEVTNINGQLAQKVSQTTFDTLKGTVTSQSTLINQNKDAIKLKADQTYVDTIKGTVANNTAAIDLNSKEIKLKASQSDVNKLSGRVTNAEAQIKLQADQIKLTVSKTELTNILGDYATQTWTQSQIKSTADQINLSVTKVQNNVDNIQVGGVNYLRNSNFEFGNANWRVWSPNTPPTGSTVEFQKAGGDWPQGTKGIVKIVRPTAHANNSYGIAQDGISVVQGREYVVSFESASTIDMTFSVGDSGNGFPFQWFHVHALSHQRTQIVFKAPAGATKCNVYFGFNGNDKGTLWISRIMMSQGNKSLDWGVNPADYTSEVQFSQLQLTVNGIQGTVANKADKSQVTQLANQITSVVEITNGITNANRNYVANSNFLDGANKWNFNEDTGLSHNAQSEPWIFGKKKALHLWGTPTTTFRGAWQVTPMPVASKGSIVYLSMLATKDGAPVSPIHTGLHFRDASGVIIDQVWHDFQMSEIPANSVAPARLEWKVVAPSAATSVNLMIYGLPNQVVNFYVTDIKLEMNSHTPWTPALEDETTKSQITQLASDINLRVQKGDVINQINISPESILIAGQKVHITGQTSIDNAVIKDAMIANVKADKITAGTLNAANVNVINLNANNITTGTIKGANLSMNLNTGEVAFQRGRIHSVSNNIDINVDEGYVSVANNKTRVLLKDGGIQFVQPNIFDLQTSPYMSIANGGSAQGIFNGASIIGRDFLALANSANNSNMFTFPMGIETFAGISFGNAGTWRPTKIGGAERGILLSGGAKMSTKTGNIFGSSPNILIGSDNGGLAFGNRIAINGEYVHIISAYRHTASGSANVIVTQDGALVRSTSASKYKTDIIRANATDYGDKLLNLPTATWTDIAETKRFRDDPINQPKPTRNFGMIAEDLADAGLEMLVVRGADGELEGINYDRIGPALIPVIAKLKNEVETLKQKIGGKSA